MAFGQHYYPATDENSGFILGCSHSYLDGVPFTISSSFRRIHETSLSPDLLQATKPSPAFREEYTFETEEAVLAWSRARDEAKARALAEQAAAEHAKASAAESATQPGEDALDDCDQTTQCRDTDTSLSQPAKPPWQLGVGVSGSSTILTPVPIQTAQQKAQSPLAPKTPVDLALFEQEADPFDNMELQTLDDMAELRTLLGGGVEGESSTSSNVCNGSNGAVKKKGSDRVASDSNSGSVSRKSTGDGVCKNIPRSSSLKMTDNESSSEVNSSVISSMPNGSKPDELSNLDSPKEVENVNRVQLGSDFRSAKLRRDSAPVTPSSRLGPVLGGELPEKYASSKILKPVLPPIFPRGENIGGDGGMTNAGTSVSGSTIPINSEIKPSLHQASNGRGMTRMSHSAYITSGSDMFGSDSSFLDQRLSYLANSNSSSARGKVNTNIYSRYGNGGSEFPSLVNGSNKDRSGLRSAKSNPDLAARGHSPVPDLSQSCTQPWNPYTPLPPTPVPDQRSGPSTPEQRYSPSPTPAPNSRSITPQPDCDPYSSLSSEAKTFVNNLTSMGFARSRASRAVEKFGSDEREVLDHLLNVDKLVEKKFSPALAETSLQLFKNDIHKAEQFLGLYQQFTELGFTSDRIQTALIKHELDRDKALDYLTA